MRPAPPAGGRRSCTRCKPVCAATNSRCRSAAPSPPPPRPGVAVRAATSNTAPNGCGVSETRPQDPPQPPELHRNTLIPCVCATATCSAVSSLPPSLVLLRWYAALVPSGIRRAVVRFPGSASAPTVWQPVERFDASAQHTRDCDVSNQAVRAPPIGAPSSAVAAALTSPSSACRMGTDKGLSAAGQSPTAAPPARVYRIDVHCGKVAPEAAVRTSPRPTSAR